MAQLARRGMHRDPTGADTATGEQALKLTSLEALAGKLAPPPAAAAAAVIAGDGRPR